MRNIEIKKAIRTGFAVMDQDTYELIAVMPSLTGLEAILAELFVEGPVALSGDTDIDDETSVQSNAEQLGDVKERSAFVIRGMSTNAAYANVIIAVEDPRGESRVEYGFLDEDAAHIAYVALHNAGVSVRYTKHKGEPINEQPDDAGTVEHDGDTVAQAPDANPRLFIVIAGSIQDPEATFTAYHDEAQARRACQLVWSAGGRATMRSAIELY